EKARDVLMLDGGDRLGLVLEAQAKVGIGQELGLEQLDRDAQADGQVLREEDLAHGAVADRTHHAIALADDVAGVDLAANVLREVFGERLELGETARKRERSWRVRHRHQPTSFARRPGLTCESSPRTVCNYF